MACVKGCNDCDCKEVSVVTNKTNLQLQDKLRVFLDLVCIVANTPCPSLPEMMAKVLYYIWCYLKDLTNQIECLRKRTNTLKKRDEELCKKQQVITGYYNAVKTQLEYLNKSNLQRYELELAKYNQDKFIASSNSDKDGFLKEVINKDLIMGSEPNATMTVVGRFVSPSVVRTLYTDTPTGFISPTALQYDSYPVKTVTSSGEHTYVVMRLGDSITVTYSDLNKTTYQGAKVDKIMFTYTLKEISGPNSQILFTALPDPTVTAFVHVLHESWKSTTFKIGTKVQVFVGGKEIVPTEANPFPVTFSSINSLNGEGEYVSDFTGEYILINGSAITVKNGKAMNYSSDYIETYASKAGSPDGSWDTPDNKYNWVGAIGGKTTKPIEFSFGNRGQAYWFAFNTGVNAGGIIIKPVKPHIIKLDDLNINCGDLTPFDCGK